MQTKYTAAQQPYIIQNTQCILNCKIQPSFEDAMSWQLYPLAVAFFDCPKVMKYIAAVTF